MDTKTTSTRTNNVRSSNLELYRIFCMLMIVAHHYVAHSGLLTPDSIMSLNPNSSNTTFLCIFGLWGKTGINCFLMITGYFMCTSKISMRKFVKLMLWIYLYKLIIYGAFLATGHETIDFQRIIKLIMPVWGFYTNFTDCFIAFWLTIPFWNILINNMSKRQHELLISLLLGIYTLLGSIPHFMVSINYITWFGIIYLTASYIRLYPIELYSNKKVWASLSILTILLGTASILIMHHYAEEKTGLFVSDSNKIFAVTIAITTFLWLKNINIPYSKLINTIGGSTFGVLLIHDNSWAMRNWLWKDIVDGAGHYSLPFWQLVGYSIGVVLAIFFICIIIDIIRIKIFEEPFFKWYDKEPRFQKFTDFLSK